MPRPNTVHVGSSPPTPGSHSLISTPLKLRRRRPLREHGWPDEAEVEWTVAHASPWADATSLMVHETPPVHAATSQTEGAVRSKPAPILTAHRATAIPCEAWSDVLQGNQSETQQLASAREQQKFKKKWLEPKWLFRFPHALFLVMITCDPRHKQ